MVDLEKPHIHIGEGIRITYLPLIFLLFLVALDVVASVYLPSVVPLTTGTIFVTVVVSAVFIGGYFLLRSESPRGMNGPESYPLRRDAVIPLPPGSALAIHQVGSLADQSATDQQIAEAFESIDQEGLPARSINRGVVSFGGWSNRFVSSPWGFEDGAAYWEGEPPFIKIGNNLFFWRAMEHRDQSDFSTRLLRTLNTPSEEGGIPPGFRVGPDGTQMFGEGQPFPEVVEWLQTSTFAQSTVIQTLGIKGIVSRVFADIEGEFKKRGVSMGDDDKTRASIVAIIKRHVETQPGLKFLMGVNFAGIDKVRQDNYLLQREIGRLEGVSGVRERTNWKLEQGVAGIQWKAAGQAARGRVAEKPYQESVAEQSRVGTSE